MYIRNGDKVTLEMSVIEYERLMMAVGTAAGAALRDKDKTMFFATLDLVNKLNDGNPKFTPYEIPEEYACPS